MTELAIIGCIIIGIIFFVIVRKKEIERFTGDVTINSIKEVTKLITHESFITDFIPIYDKEEEIALLKFDAKIQVTFDLELIEFEKGTEKTGAEIKRTEIIKNLPDPKIVAIEKHSISERKIDNFEQSEFIPIKKGISITRKTINNIEKGYLEEYKRRPEVVKVIEDAKHRFLLDINSFARALGAKFEIRLSEELKKMMENNKQAIENIDVINESIKPFKYTITKEDELVPSEEAELLYEKFLIFIYLIKIDSRDDISEKNYFEDAIEKTIISEFKKKELYDLLENAKINNDNILSAVCGGITNVFKSKEEVSTILPSPNYGLLKKYSEISEQLIIDLCVLANADNEVHHKEVDFIKKVAKNIGVNKSVIDNELAECKIIAYNIEAKNITEEKDQKAIKNKKGNNAISKENESDSKKSTDSIIDKVKNFSPFSKKDK